MHRFLQRDGIGDAFGQRLVDIQRHQSAVGSEVITFDDFLDVFEIDVLFLHLLGERVGTEVEFIHLAVEVSVGITRYVFAQRREGDDEGGDDDEQQGNAEDDQNEVE